jgi:hypothetical protein
VRRGRVEVRLGRLVCGRAAVWLAAAASLVAPDAELEAGAESVASGSVAGVDDAAGGVAGAGRGVIGRRERLATGWKSPVGAMARGARGRRLKSLRQAAFPCLIVHARERSRRG